MPFDAMRRESATLSNMGAIVNAEKAPDSSVPSPVSSKYLFSVFRFRQREAHPCR